MAVLILGIAMNNLVQYLSTEPKQQPVESFSVQERLVARNKGDLDRMVEVKQRHGWLLLLRTYSMDEGHGAVVARRALGNAARDFKGWRSSPA